MYSHKKTHVTCPPICHFSGPPAGTGKATQDRGSNASSLCPAGPCGGLGHAKRALLGAGFAPALLATLPFFSSCPAGLAVASGSRTWLSKHPAPLSSPTAASAISLTSPPQLPHRPQAQLLPHQDSLGPGWPSAPTCMASSRGTASPQGGRCSYPMVAGLWWLLGQGHPPSPVLTVAAGPGRLPCRPLVTAGKTDLFKNTSEEKGKKKTGNKTNKQNPNKQNITFRLGHFRLWFGAGCDWRREPCFPALPCSHGLLIPLPAWVEAVGR